MTRVHLTILLAEADVAQIASLRRRFDPVMAAGVAPHVSLVYPEEHLGRLDPLLSRVERVAREFAPFSMTLGDVVVDDDDGTAGVFIRVDDPTGSWCALRERIVVSPYQPIDVEPHLTIVHPRTSGRGPSAWRELAGSNFAASVAVHAVVLSSTDAHGLRVERTFDLAGRARRLCAAVIPVDREGRVLLGRRRDDAASYPGVWDLIGGGVEAGESVVHAARREVAEEVGLAVAPSELRFVDTVVTDGYEVATHAVATSARVENRARDEHAEIGWHHPASLAEIALSDAALPDLCRRACELVRR